METSAGSCHDSVWTRHDTIKPLGRVAISLRSGCTSHRPHAPCSTTAGCLVTRLGTASPAFGQRIATLVAPRSAPGSGVACAHPLGDFTLAAKLGPGHLGRTCFRQRVAEMLGALWTLGLVATRDVSRWRHSTTHGRIGLRQWRIARFLGGAKHCGWRAEAAGSRGWPGKQATPEPRARSRSEASRRAA